MNNTQRSFTLNSDLYPAILDLVDKVAAPLLAVGFAPEASRLESLRFIETQLQLIKLECEADLATHRFGLDFATVEGDGYRGVCEEAARISK